VERFRRRDPLGVAQSVAGECSPGPFCLIWLTQTHMARTRTAVTLLTPPHADLSELVAEMAP
jgi:hypothetical protein